MTKRHILLGLGLLAAVSLIGASCEKKVTETLLEDQLEDSTNGQANVDIDNDTVTVNTNEGSFQAGDNLSLPSDFPSDVYVASGNIMGVTSVTNSAGFSVTIQTNDSLDSVKSAYERELVSDGWTVTGTATYGGYASISAEKDARTTSVGITTGDGSTTVILTTSNT